MPAALIEEIGFRDAAHGWHSQRYLPQSVPGADATVRDEIDALSSCLHESTAEGGIERFTLSISQLPFNDVLPAGYQSKDDTPVTAAGLKAYVNPGLKADSFNARFTSADGKTQAHLGASGMSNVGGITDPKAAFMKLLEGVAANLAKGPQGRTTHVPSRKITGDAVMSTEKIGDFAACGFWWVTRRPSPSWPDARR